MDEVQKRNEVILAKAGEPVARLVGNHGPACPRAPGAMAGGIWIAPNFDTLPADIGDAFGMREPRK